LDAGIDAFSAISKYIFLLFCPFHSMRTFALVLACFAFTGHARRVQDMQGGDGIENGAAKLTAREWELQNLARRRMGKMSNGELGLANLMSAARDPSMLNELAQMPAANQNFVELQKMLADPDFRKQASNFAERMHLSTDAAASSFLQDAKHVYEQIKTYIGHDHLSTLEQSQSGLDSLVEVGESTAPKRFTPASAFVPAAKSLLPRISQPRSTAVTQMSTGVADVDNVGITQPLGFFDLAQEWLGDIFKGKAPALISELESLIERSKIDTASPTEAYQSDIVGIAMELESLNPNPNPVSSGAFKRLDGEWELLYSAPVLTSIDTSTKRLAGFGKSDGNLAWQGVDRAKEDTPPPATQTFDITNGAVKNTARFKLLGKIPSQFSLSGTIVPSVQEPNKRADIQFFQVALQIGQLKLKLPLPVDATGWIEITYLSPEADFLIDRGDKGTLFVLRRLQ